ncbi:MAG: DUF4382 domain-containing protein [Nevskiaceae bacterium]|nr:MAG: DUF4382 domain-containing protein [Nevskiaceae bacterium]
MALWRRCLTVLLLAVFTMMSGCGGGGGSGGSASSGPSGFALISLADAPGDFLAYRVTVTSVQLSGNGAPVETLSAPERVNFVNLISTAELFENARVPAGTYTGVHMTVDFSNAEIFVQNASGAPVKATVEDASGSPLSGPLGVDVSFPAASPLVVSQGATANLALDFNLAASNAVSFPPGGGAVVKVSPVLGADPKLLDGRPRHLRGKVDAVDSTAQTLTFSVIPFDDDNGDATTPAAKNVVASVDGNTRYEINGHPYTGASGLSALAALTLPVLAELTGAIEAGTGKLVATAIIAGSGEGHPSDDGVQGHVLSRSATTLNLIGDVHEHGAPGSTFGQAITVDISQVQAVLKGDDGKADQAGPLTTAAIGVGQRVQVFGAITRNGDGTTITAKLVRLLPTVIKGTANQAYSSGASLPITLKSFDGLAAKLFTFTGTGSSANGDSNASAYQVDLSAVSPAPSIATGNPVTLGGFAAPWGSAPPDFIAVAAVNDHHPGEGDPQNRLHLVWSPPGSAAPFTSASATQLLIKHNDPLLEQGGGVSQGDQTTPVSSMTTDLSLTPGSGHGQRFVLVSGYDNSSASSRTETEYAAFADFESALAAQLGGGAKLRLIDAEGVYTPDGNGFAASELMAAVQSPPPAH